LVASSLVISTNTCWAMFVVIDMISNLREQNNFDVSVISIQTYALIQFLLLVGG
jgi:hypothetical protein